MSKHPLRVLVACEYSGRVRDAFKARGAHYQGDVRDVLIPGAWDLLIAFPPCTHLAVSGARWFKDKRAEQADALRFVRMLLDAPVPHIALENPVSIISSHIRKPDQTFQPWQFGHGEVKRTCLWLKGLPKLQPTDIVEGREARVWKMGPSPDRWRERSRTFAGVADAMADQWTRYLMTLQDGEENPGFVTPEGISEASRVVGAGYLRQSEASKY
jgi:site-specific DNA-cytosine methylase